MVLDVSFTILLDVLKMLAPVAPFISEQIYQNLKFAFSLEGESIHLFHWPQAEEKFMDKELEKNMAIAKDTVQAILSGREKIKLGVRWPIQAAKIASTDAIVHQAVDALKSMIMNQANCKELLAEKTLSEAVVMLEPNFKTLGSTFKKLSPKIIAYLQHADPAMFLKTVEKEGKVTTTIDGQEVALTREHIIVKTKTPDHFVSGDYKHGELYIDARRTPTLDAEGYAREVMRRIQELRKEMGLARSDIVQVHLLVDAELEKMLDQWEKEIKAKCGISDLVISQEDLPLKHKAEEMIKGKGIVIYAEQCD